MEPDIILPEPPESFINLAVRLEWLAEGVRYRVTTMNNRGYEQHDERTWPYAADEELLWIETLNGEVEEADDRTLVLRDVGTALFDSIFFGERLLSEWRVARSLIRRGDPRRVLRLALEFGDPRFERLPWETMYDRREDGFLALDPEICLIRRVPGTDASPPPPVTPLRVLGVIAQPRGVTALDTEREKAILTDGLKAQLERNAVQLDWLNGRARAVTLEALKDRLDLSEQADRPYHLLHFIGHASWDEQKQNGVVWFENEKRDAVAVDGDALAEILPASLHMVVLNACEGARNEDTVPFRSVTSALMEHSSLPAVIASQVRLRDVSAHHFTHAFYRTLADYRSVEEGMMAARARVYKQANHPPQWYGPVFLTRALRQPTLLLDRPTPRRAVRWLYALGLFLLTILMGIIVVTLVRVLGWVGGIAFQLLIWLFAALLAYMNRDFVRQAIQETLVALAAATLVIGFWFLAFQPQLDLPSQEGATVQIEPLPTQVRNIARVQGTVSGLAGNEHLWLLVQEVGGRTYTAGDEARLSAGGRFEVAELRVGPPADRLVGNRRYVIQAVIVDDAGHRFLQEHASGFWRFFHPDIRVQPPPTLPRVIVTRR